MAHDVFISHSAKDKPTADAVCAMLESNGVRCWIAPRDVTAGMEWSECIIDAIGECKIMVLVFTTHANDSSQIRREVERAVNHGVAVLPFRIEDVVPGKALEYFIGNVHWLDALTPPLETHLRNLSVTVKTLLGRMDPQGRTIPTGQDRPGSPVAPLIPAAGSKNVDSAAPFQPTPQKAAPVESPVFAPPPNAYQPPASSYQTPAAFQPPPFVPSPVVVPGTKAPLLSQVWFRAVLGGVGLLVLVLIVLLATKGSGTTSGTGTGTSSSPSDTDWSKADINAVVAGANAGNGKAEAELGHRYFFGRDGETQDYAQAIVWYRKAADQGDTSAETNLGFMYSKGQGVTIDHAQALFWYRKAAMSGDATAQNNLGYLYREGIGTTQDFTQALQWYHKSADQGNANAQTSLGYMYYNGKGVPQDYSQAITWFRKGADQGSAEAQYDMGLCYQYGHGTAIDLGQARIWYQKAADQGDESSKKQLAGLNGGGDVK
jgi:TPR repeat protein